MAGAVYLLEFVGEWQWLHARWRASPPRPSPGTRFLAWPTFLSLLGVGVAAALIFVPWLAAKIVLVVVLVGVGVTERVVVWRRAAIKESRRPLSSRLMTDEEISEAKWDEHKELKAQQARPRLKSPDSTMTRVSPAARRVARQLLFEDSGLAAEARTVHTDGFEQLDRLEAKQSGFANAVYGPLFPVMPQTELRTWLRRAHEVGSKAGHAAADPSAIRSYASISEARQAVEDAMKMLNEIAKAPGE